MSHLLSLVSRFALAAALLLALGALPAGAQDEFQEDNIIQIGPDGRPGDPLANPRAIRGREPNFRPPHTLPGNPADLARQSRPASPYFIGVAAEKVSDAVRSHVDLPDGVGLMVFQVFDDSPAAEAELKKYDILLRADGKDLEELDDLINIVDEHAGDGDNMTQFTLDLIRHGRPETVWVTPAVRPEQPAVMQPVLPNLRPEERRMLERMMRNRVGRPNFDGLRPDAFGMEMDLNELPSGVSITIQREGDSPAKVTVNRGDESWEIEGDDAAALEQLPEDLRPMVERMLQGGQEMAPAKSDGVGMPADMEQRLEQMEQQMQELREQLLDQPE